MNGKRLREIRKERKLTLEQLSKLSGVSISTLSEIENGIASVTIKTAKAIAAALHVDLKELIE